MNERLLSAAESGDTNTVRKLLKKLPLVDVNTKDELGVSALSKAAKGGHFDVAQLLLEAGALVNRQDGVLVTPLHLAARANHAEVLKLLVLSGAVINVENKEGLRPLDMARYETDAWDILHKASTGVMPEIHQISEVPVIPDFAVAAGTAPKKKKKKGKKKGGKKGGKKKGKKKK